MFKYVLIDIDNTIIDFKKSSIYAIKNAFADNGFPYDDNVMEVYHTVSAPLWDKVEKREMTGEQLRLIRWGLIFDALGIKYDGDNFEKQWRDYLSDAYFEIEGACDLLEYLSKKYTVCIASNSYYNQQSIRLIKAGMMPYVDYIFVSSRIGYEKPDERFFSACLSLLKNPDKSEVIMIGDSLRADVGGAKKFGIKSCWVNLNGEQDSIGADYEVKKLCEIKDIL